MMNSRLQFYILILLYDKARVVYESWGLWDNCFLEYLEQAFSMFISFRQHDKSFLILWPFNSTLRRIKQEKEGQWSFILIAFWISVGSLNVLTKENMDLKQILEVSFVVGLWNPKLAKLWNDIKIIHCTLFVGKNIILGVLYQVFFHCRPFHVLFPYKVILVS